MLDFMINAGLIVLILGTSALATKAYASAMYNRCPECATLNAKRRPACRTCGHPFAANSAGTES